MCPTQPAGDPKDMLANAAGEARRRVEGRMGGTSSWASNVLMLNRADFFAEARHDGDHAAIRISSGCVDAIRSLWRDALSSRILIDERGDRISSLNGASVSEEYLVHLSMTWLVLHEVMHIRLGHLDLLGWTHLVEMDLESFDTEKPVSKRHWSTRLTVRERGLMRPCLELQADNDATEAMFGIYDESQWTRFRIEAAAIFVVVALMEKTEQRLKQRKRTYPRVATRFFTLFAQLFQYWLYGDAKLEARRGESFIVPARDPKGEDFARYMKTVLALALSDAIQIALWADAKSFLDDFGAGAALFSDLYEIQYARSLKKAKLKTPSAREWRRLLPVNEKIMALSGLRVQAP